MAGKRRRGLCMLCLKLFVSKRRVGGGWRKAETRNLVAAEAGFIYLNSQ